MIEKGKKVSQSQRNLSIKQTPGFGSYSTDEGRRQTFGKNRQNVQIVEDKIQGELEPVVEDNDNNEDLETIDQSNFADFQEAEIIINQQQTLNLNAEKKFIENYKKLSNRFISHAENSIEERQLA